VLFFQLLRTSSWRSSSQNLLFILSSSSLKKETGMRRTPLLFSTAVVLLASGAVLALPSEVPDDTPRVDGRLRAIEHLGTKIWLT